MRLLLRLGYFAGATTAAAAVKAAVATATIAATAASSTNTTNTNVVAAAAAAAAAATSIPSLVWTQYLKSAINSRFCGTFSMFGVGTNPSSRGAGLGLGA